MSKRPTSAFSDHVAYDQGRNDRWPDQNYTYKCFKRLASIPVADAVDPFEAQLDASAVLSEAQMRYGSHVKVMRTARHWVVYTE